MASTKQCVCEALETRLQLDGATRISDILPGTDSSLALSAGHSASANGKFFFEAVDAHGTQPYVSDGTAAGTKPLVPDGLNGGASCDPGDFIAGGGFVYFTAVIGPNSRRQVFRSDGTTAGTINVSKLAEPGSASNLDYVNGHLIFFDINNFNLYRVDNKVSVKIGAGNSSGYYGNAGNKAFYNQPGLVNTPTGLFVTDGATNTFLAGVSSYLLPTGAALNNKLIFETTGIDNNDDELWTSDGTIGGTARISGFVAPGGGGPHDFTLSGNSLYFEALNSSGSSIQIFRTDGLTAKQVTSFPGAQSITSLTDVNGTLFFVYAGGKKPYLYKLVNDKAVLVGTTSGGTDGGTSPANLVAIGGTLYFSGVDMKGKVRLFESDGTSISLVPGDTGTDPTGLTNVNGTLFFQASDDQHGSELHIFEAEAPSPEPFEISLSTKQNGKVVHTINEGESLHFTFKIQGDEALKLEWDWQDGTFTKGGDIRDHTFKDNLKNDATRMVRLKVTTAQHGVKNLFTEVTVKNLPPKIIKFSVPTEVAAFLRFSSVFTVDDPGVEDGMTVTVKWGDGTSSTTTVEANKGPASDEFRHQYKIKSATPLSVRIEVDDGEGGVAVRRVPISVISIARVVTDGKEVGFSFGGTSGDDKVIVRKSAEQPIDPNQVALDIVVNGKTQGSTIVSRSEVIQADMGPGKDLITVATDVPNPLLIDTDGEDTVSSNGGTYTPADGLGLFGTSEKDNISAQHAATQTDPVVEGLDLFINGIHYGARELEIEQTEKNPRQTLSIYSLGGNDKVTSGALNALLVIYAGSGNDTMTAGAGPTSMFGGPGKDKGKNLGSDDTFKQ